jgi:hypothetical protein
MIQSVELKQMMLVMGEITYITIDEPNSLADPSHWKWVFSCDIHSLAAALQKTSKVSNGLSGHLTYCYGACVKSNRDLLVEQLSLKMHNVT